MQETEGLWTKISILTSCVSLAKYKKKIGTTTKPDSFDFIILEKQKGFIQKHNKDTDKFYGKSVME